MFVTMKSATTRFSGRVEDYIRYRPGYPAAVLQTLRDECGLTKRDVVADVGSGTGILSVLFLENGNEVFGVEPNREMREAGERLFSWYPHFHSVDGTAEATGLNGASVDLVSAGQAFHWFDRGKARAEFLRILRPRGRVVIVWNERLADTTPFLRAYEELLKKHGTDYAQVDHRRLGADIMEEFFGEGRCAVRKFPHSQKFDFTGAMGRLLSSSFVPGRGEPGYDAMIADFRRIFDAHQREGSVEFEYLAVMYYGRLAV
jgi:SAM-dependent methyltransferase